MIDAHTAAVAWWLAVGLLVLFVGFVIGVALCQVGINDAVKRRDRAERQVADLKHELSIANRARALGR